VIKFIDLISVCSLSKVDDDKLSASFHQFSLTSVVQL